MNSKQNIERTVQNYFNGQLSAEEEAELLEWIKADEKNKEFFFRIKENIQPQKIEYTSFHDSFVELQGKILINQQFKIQGSNRIRRFQLSFTKVAAMLVVALITGFSFSFLLNKDKVNENKIVWFETHVPRGEKSQLLLPDGSKIWMNSESSVSYASNFMDGNREIILKGEAYFEVSKLHGLPFIVKTNDFDIKVLGTKFNVMAYPDFNRTETSLIEGKIEIKKGKQTFPIIPGQTFSYSENKYEIMENNVSLTTKWKDDVFDFDKISFEELILRLERWYDVDIEIKDPELNKIIYSGVFKNEETIWQVFNTLQLTMPIRYEHLDFRKFIIEKNR